MASNPSQPYSPRLHAFVRIGCGIHPRSLLKTCLSPRLSSLSRSVNAIVRVLVNCRRKAWPRSGSRTGRIKQSDVHGLERYVIQLNIAMLMPALSEVEHNWRHLIRNASNCFEGLYRTASRTCTYLQNVLFHPAAI